MKVYKLYKSDKPTKKYMVITPEQKKIYFGASGYEDYTTHKSNIRKNRYILRHQNNEDWTPTGMNTAGWWSRWILWNKPSLMEAIKFIEKNFNIIILT
jgi:hypothetical protein